MFARAAATERQTSGSSTKTSASQSHGAAHHSGVLQRSLGNSKTAGAPRWIQRKCSCGGSCEKCTQHDEGARIQTKVAVGPVNDAFEVEADRVAESVMHMPEANLKTNRPPDIQRMTAQSSGSDASHSGIDLALGGGEPLSPEVRQFMEPRFGTSFDHVRVHADEHAQDTAKSIQARAFTYGPDIWLGSGESQSDHQLMAHELTHVVQQDADPQVQRTPQASRCPDGIKTLNVDLVSLRGSSRDPVDDLAFANAIFSPCCVDVRMSGGATIGATDSDTWLGGDTIMSRGTARGAIHAEQRDAYDGATASLSLSGRIRAFYVDETAPALGRATSFPAVWATGTAAPYEGMAVVTNRGVCRSLAHEIGHILLNVDGTVHTTHPGGTDNLMEPSDTATGETLEPAQCATIFAAL